MNTNTKKWLYGLASAIIGGGAGAVTASVTVCVIDPEKFNPAAQTLHFMELGVSVFLVNAFLSAFFYLKQSPLPPESITQTVDTSTVTQDSSGKVIQKVSSTVTTTPVPPAEPPKTP